MSESIGMMEGAYFVGRAALLEWINSLTGLGYTKIEQTASGVAACHVFDALFPGKLKLEKVNFDAKRDYEFVHNYKVLQAAFKRLGISKDIFVERLIRAKYQDNLEFMQWVKGYFDLHASDDALNYDARARRASIGRADRAPRAARPDAKSTAASRARDAAAAARRQPAAPPPRARRVTPRAGAVPPAQKRAPRGAAAAGDSVPRAELEAMRKECDDLTRLVQEGDCEREFYFQKLQQIEGVMQDLEEKYKDEELDSVLIEVATLIKEILYEETPDGEQPCDDGAQGDPHVGDPEPHEEVLQPDEQAELGVGQLALE